MVPVALEGNYGQSIEIDTCAHCNLLWIDDLESVRLSGLGWITLLRRIHADSTTGLTQTLQLPLACPRCASQLHPVRNLTRFGRTAAHECPNKHGYFQTFALLLAERGLVRPLGPRDRAALQAEGRDITCLSCGAAIGGDRADRAERADHCSHCASPLVVLDFKRLMASVMVRHALPLPADDAQMLRWSCRGCGDTVDPTLNTVCDRCGHAVVAPSLADALPMLAVIEPQLQRMRAPGPQPLGERLRRQRGYGSTAFFRHLVRPWKLGVQQEIDYFDWRTWRPSSPVSIVAVGALLLWLWWR